MESKTILTIDCGTQSLRGILFSSRGKILAHAQVIYDAYFSHNPGWAEQDPLIYWKSLLKACHRLKKASPTWFDAIEGVGITAQRASMVNVDKKGDPLRPVIIWLDKRSSKPVWSQKPIIGPVLKIMGLKKKIQAVESQGKCNWIMQNQPEIWQKTDKYLQLSGFLNFKLTGEFRDSTASQIGHLPFRYKKQVWAKPFHLERLLFPVEPQKLPQLVLPGELLGNITTIASEQSGLKKGIQVFACGSDKGCETLGAGVLSSKMASLSFGTAATIQTLSEKYIEPIKLMRPYPACVPNLYNPEIEVFRGYWMISWFKKEFAHKEVETAKNLGVPVETILDQCLERSEPGAMGLIVQPYWGAGLDHPDAKGAMIGFGDAHTKDHVYRAVIEGLGFALFEGMQKIEKKSKVKFVKAAVSGGASQSDAICRITADIFNLPMEKGQTHETSSLGAAILTAKGLGWYPDIQNAVKQMVKVKHVFEPDPANVRIYKDLYSQVYRQMYGALKPLYKKIRQITG